MVRVQQMIFWCLIVACVAVAPDVRDVKEHPGVWVLLLKDGVDPEKVAREHQLVYSGPVKGMSHFHIFELGAHSLQGGGGGRRRSVQVEAALAQDAQVTLFEPQTPKKRFKRNV